MRTQMANNFLTESDFKYIKHSNFFSVEKIEFEDFKIYKKTPEEYLADTVYFDLFLKRDDQVFSVNSDNYVSEFFINIKATCKTKESKTKKAITLQADLNALTLKSLVKFCIESRNLDVINYITNKNFYLDKENQNLVQVSSEYGKNALVQNTLRSIFTKMAAKQTLENFEKLTDFSCEIDDSLKNACKDMPKATDFKLDNETKQFHFEKTFYEDDKRFKTTYTLYNKNNHTVYEVNNYVLASSYTFIGGFKVDTKGSEISFRTIKVIDGEKYFIDREYENRKLVYTFIGDENSRTLE